MTFKAAKGAFLIAGPCVAVQVPEAEMPAPPPTCAESPTRASPTSLSLRGEGALQGAGHKGWGMVSPSKLGSRCLPRWHQLAGSPVGKGQVASGRDSGGCAARPLHQPGRELRFLLSPDTPASEVAGSRAAAGPQCAPDPAVPLEVPLLFRRHSHLSLGIGLQAGEGPNPALRGATGHSLSFSTCEGQLSGAVGFYLTWVGQAVLEPRERAVTWGHPPGPRGKGHMCEVGLLDRPNPHTSRLPELPTPT